MMLLLSGLVHAAKLHVPADYSIQDAIEAAQDGDEIAVGPGMYRVALDLRGKSLRLFSTDGPQSTVLRSTVSKPVLKVMDGATGASLEGFTIEDGEGTEQVWIVGNGWMGGGVFVHQGSLTILDCVFSGNEATASGQSGGGALFVLDGDVWVRDSVFEDNLGFYAGGAALVARGTLSIQDSTFRFNHARRGGAVAAFDDSELNLSSNTYQDNRAGWGGAVFGKDSEIYSENDVVLEHSVWRNGGAWALENTVAGLEGAYFSKNRAQDDGGQVYLSQGSELTLHSSWFDQGFARAGGGVFMRGKGTSLSVDGLLMSANQATEGGADLWVSEGSAVIQQLTSLFPGLPDSGLGVLVFARDNAQVILSNLIVYGGAGGSLVELLNSALSWSEGIVFEFSGNLGGAQSVGALEADPLLTDLTPGSLDPSLATGSPAFNAGVEGSLDLDGTQADLGATGGLFPWQP